MAFVEMVPEDRAVGKLAQQYALSRRRDRRIANIVRVMSQNPEALDDLLRLYTTIAYGPSGLTRAQREMVAVVVSRANGCRYCMEGHAKDLRVEIDDVALVRAVKTDHRAAPIDPPTRALLDYADKLARRPAEMTREDVDRLRQHGFSERDVTDLAHNVAFFAYINRMAAGLGVDLEPFMLAGGENVAPGEPIAEPPPR